MTADIKRKGIVYCSGPLFSPEEVVTMEKIAAVLESCGYETFLPHRDGVEAFIMNQVNSPFSNAYIFKPVKKAINKFIFALDIYQITERCDYFVFNMNGRVPDEGGVVELAVALAMGKPLLIYKEDYRSQAYGWDNYMFSGIAGENCIVEDIDIIPEALHKVIREDKTPCKEKIDLRYVPPFVRKVNKTGRFVWSVLNKIKVMKPGNSLLQ